jgi:biopolymer transport protein ExbD
MATRRLDRRHEPAQDAELNLVSYLDVMVNLILFMLVTYTVGMGFRTIPVDPPASAPGPAPAKLDGLTVAIGAAGFQVLGDGSFRSRTIPRARGDYDYAALTRTVTEVSRDVDLASAVNIVAEPDIPYDVVVHTLDATRMDPYGQPLLPHVTLGIAP